MNKLYFILASLFLLQAAMPAQSVVKNTAVASMCGCPGEIWNFSTPYKPYVAFPIANNSKRLMHTDYAFNIPSTATITGYQVSFSYSCVNAPANTLKDTLCTLILNGNLLGNDQSGQTAYFGNSGTFTYGGPGDTWGAALSPADVNSAGFGFNFKSISSVAGSELHFTNGAIMTIYYTLASGISESQSTAAGMSAYVSGRSLKLSGNATERTTVEIFDLTGKKVIMGSLQSKQDAIDLSALGKGVYVYRTECAGKSRASKFILD